MSREHATHIEAEPGEGHYAVCSCGWTGYPRCRAEDDAEDHEHGVALDCTRCTESHEYACAP